MKGWIITEEGKMFEQELPINTHADIVAWGEDMLRKIHEFSRFRKWLLRLVLGRYAYRELVGLRDAIDKLYPDLNYKWTEVGYGLETCEYHKDKVAL